LHNNGFEGLSYSAAANALAQRRHGFQDDVLPDRRFNHVDLLVQIFDKVFRYGIGRTIHSKRDFAVKWALGARDHLVLVNMNSFAAHATS